MSILYKYLFGQLPAINSAWLLITRLLVGIFFVGSGYGKLFTEEGKAKMLKAIIDSGIPFPELNAFIASSLELVGGLLLTIGLLTIPSAFSLFVVMTVAMVTNFMPTPDKWTFIGLIYHFVYLPEFLYLLIFVGIIANGGGTYSVDHLLIKRLQGKSEPTA